MPERKDVSCPVNGCGKPAVGLVCDETSVVWCETGHVSVTGAGLVHDFCNKRVSSNG